MLNVRVYHIGTSDLIEEKEFEIRPRGQIHWENLGRWLAKNGYLDGRFRISIIVA
jgi:hypothetical protein